MATAKETRKGPVKGRNLRIPWNIESHLQEEQVGQEGADGVYQLRSTMTNMYLIEGDDGLTLVDSGLRMSTTKVC